MRKGRFRSGWREIYAHGNVHIHRNTPAFVRVLRVRPLIGWIFPVCHGFIEGGSADLDGRERFGFLLIVVRIARRHFRNNLVKNHFLADPLTPGDRNFYPVGWVNAVNGDSGRNF